MIGLIILLVYVAIFIVSFLIVRFLVQKTTTDYTALKTVTFGDESAVTSNRVASVVSVLTIFLIWGSFTGSVLIPRFLHAPGPFVGETSFTYTIETPEGARDDATIFVRVMGFGEETVKFEVPPGDGIAKDDAVAMPASRSTTIIYDKNDEVTRKDGARLVAIDGETIGPDIALNTDVGRFALTEKGAITFAPPKGLQMEPIWLPPPEAVVGRVIEIANDGYRDSTLWKHLGYSLFRVIAGFFFGALLGIPLGYAMGLSNWFRGWFEPIVEFMRPVPPLALIPLVIIWFGIGETGKIILLFLASLWIMAISARAGVSGVNITKVHAAYSLGASKIQILRNVIIPNSLPEIFTGARVAMGVCWGTVVAAELVAASEGAGMMIMVASKFQLTDIVLMGIILIGVIGFGIDILMRRLENLLVPWKGRS
ncbi:taurine transport system permease protein [Shimia abyssi]|uniref:Taurine transport system permease protein n=1 Tax=Shimia abyssi TaxID=1662395 RepID=A0A2P8FFQ3_9RHOB|nr:taurine transport system permease protein [Shimia abyssi]